MPPAPDDQPVLKDDDLLGVDDGRHALGDDDDRGFPRHRREGRPQPGVGRDVKGRKGIVEEVDLGTTHEGPGDGQALTLPAGDIGAALGNRCVQTFGHGADEVFGLGDAQGLPELLVGGVGVAVTQGGGDGAGEEVRLLRDQADA